MYPAGVERSELAFSVSIAPNETITISHNEWSVSSQTYEEIAQDYFESYSERGVTEKSDTSSPTDNESHKSNATNFGVKTSGTYFGVSMTATLGLASTKRAVRPRFGELSQSLNLYRVVEAWSDMRRSGLPTTTERFHTTVLAG